MSAETERKRLERRAERFTAMAQVRFSQPGKAASGVWLLKAARLALEKASEIGDRHSVAARLEACRRHHDQMKLINRYLRTGNEDGLKRMGFTVAHIADLKTPDLIGRIGFSNDTLKASNATIARLEARLEAISCKP